MKNLIKLIWLVALTAATVVWAGPREDAAAASARGDYATAQRIIQAAARIGEAWAQNNLGVMFESGRGVAKSDAEAVRWYRLAAAQGNELAMDNLAKITVDRAVATHNSKSNQGGDCRPRTSNLVCYSTCSNGDCLVSYENGCKMRVQVNPKFDPLTNNWTYPAPSC